MVDEFEEDLDNLDFDLEENKEEDFDAEFDDEAPAASVASSSSSRIDIYMAMLIISAAFYLIALVATMAEMAPYCTDFLGGLF